MNSLGQSLQELSFGPRLPPSGTANFRRNFAVQNAGEKNGQGKFHHQFDGRKPKGKDEF